MFIGDFNEILHQHEKSGAAIRPYSQLESFKLAVEDSGLSDLGFHGDKYTYSNNREGKDFTKGRLDRAFGNSM